MKQLVCIGCPKGCNLTVDEEHDYTVKGNSCEVGARYGKEELTNPTRVLTTTVRLTGSSHLKQLPVKSSKPIAKALIFKVMDQLENVEIAVPVEMGEIIVENVLNTGVDIIACRQVKN